MKSEALELQFETWKQNRVLVLRGRFTNEQIPNIRERMEDFLGAGERSFVLDLSEVSELDDAVPAFLLEILNLVRGKEGSLRIIYGTEVVWKALESHRNLFELHADRQSLFSGGILKRLQARGITMSRKTGIRISRPVAMVLLISLSGFLLSLLAIISIQHSQIRSQKSEVAGLRKWRSQTLSRMETLEQRLRPLEDLIRVPDSLQQ